MVEVLTVGEEFSSLLELESKLTSFEDTNFVQLYIRRSRSIQGTSSRAPKKTFNEDLKYSEIDLACTHGGKNFKSTSKGKRPNQK